MKRKLVTIQKIEKLTPLPNADNLLLAKILGWQVIVRKDENFAIGDKIVFCEVDSLLPLKPEFEFLRKNCLKKDFRGIEMGFLIRTIKLRGYLSQGLVLPLTTFRCVNWEIKGDEVININNPQEHRPLKEDVPFGDILGITKYEPPVPTSGEILGAFPSFVPKTDEIRIQSVPQVLLRNIGTEYYVTEKIDGSSVTFYYNEGKFGACSREVELKQGNNSPWIMAKKLDLENKMKTCAENIALQGELIGPNVCHKNYATKDYFVYFFNVYNIEEQRYLNFATATNYIRQFDLKEVPLIVQHFKPKTLQDIEGIAKGNSFVNKSIQREGIVVRSEIEIKDVEIGRLSFKCINPDYLLKFQD